MRVRYGVALTLAVLLAPAAARAAVIQTIDFTAAEGYVDGTLNGQNGWVINNNPNVWTVDATAGTATHSASGTPGFAPSLVNGGAPLNLGIGQSATLRTVIQLGGDLISAGGLGGRQIFEVGIGTAKNLPNGYAAQLYLNNGNLALVSQAFGNAANLSIADNGNDRIAIDMTYTRTGAEESSVSWQMFNLAKPANISNIGLITGAADLTALMTTLDPVNTFHQSFYSTNTTGVTSITMWSTQVAAVPEPSVLFLAGLGMTAAALGVARRRRRLAADIDR